MNAPFFNDLYGDEHKAEREKYASFIEVHGFICMERVCVWPTRVILPGGRWDLAHDHERGGKRDYLGPAHRECNKAEAYRRRGTPEDLEALQALMERVHEE